MGGGAPTGKSDKKKLRSRRKFEWLFTWLGYKRTRLILPTNEMTTAVTQSQINSAIAAMLKSFRGNQWMLNEHWALVESHVRLMIADTVARFPPGPDTRLLDVGCFNGYVSIIFKRLGYDVTGADACELEDQRALFAESGIEFVRCNMNESHLFSEIVGQSFDVVIIAQVIEHILNHPLGLIRDLARLMRPGALMILTTPNPATVMGALRALTGRSMLWGTQEFIDQPKIDARGVISQGDIHYREYTNAEIHHLLESAGLHIETSRYLGLGNGNSQSIIKRIVKHNPLTQKLMTSRLFGSNHYFLARKR
jgi:2-polyprenyl-3-methyl-5-hydroxy-6-metoxy-1,4-benzoquinol methylase